MIQINKKKKIYGGNIALNRGNRVTFTRPLWIGRYESNEEEIIQNKEDEKQQQEEKTLNYDDINEDQDDDHDMEEIHEID